MVSPYFHASLFLLILTSAYWSREDWWLQPMSVLPNLLGFTLGGFAIFLAFGDQRFQELIAGQKQGSAMRHSPYLGVAATFMHFALVQLVALIVATTEDAVHKAKYLDLSGSREYLAALAPIFNALGYWLYLYSLCAGVAAILAIFRVATWYDAFISNQRSPEDNGKS